MIKSIHLTNFFSFKDETIDLQSDATLLVGINGSGKSNLIKAIKLLKTGVEGNARDTALLDLIVAKWGGFDNIFCKGEGENKFKNSIQLEFVLDGAVLSKYGETFQFDEDIFYKITLTKKPNFDSYFVRESIQTVSGFIFLDFNNGTGAIKARANTGESLPVKYEDYNPQELTLSKISEFDKDRYLPLITIKRAIKDIAIYEYFDVSSDSVIRDPIPATSTERKLAPNGSNLSRVLNTIQIEHRKFYQLIQQKLKDVNGKFAGITFRILGGGVFDMMLDEDGLDSAIHLSHISDGTLRYLCLLAIFYNPNRGSFICIDEPEIGLHPDMILNVALGVQEAATNTISTSSFVIATHSENLLNAFKVENVRVFEKNDQNVSEVFSYSESEFEGWYDHFSPGVMWRAGDIGGKRW